MEGHAEERDKQGSRAGKNRLDGVLSRAGGLSGDAANRDAKKLKQLTFNTAGDEYPAYSSDGKHIAFTTRRDGNYEVYEMKANGADPTNLTDDPASDHELAWQPK